MAEVEHIGPVLSEGPTFSYRARLPPQPYVPQPQLDPYDRKLWMTPAEAIEWVRSASGNVLSLEAGPKIRAGGWPENSSRRLCS
jgi:hypothetical protein